MQYSKHNIFGPLADGSGFYLVNVLSGQADVLTPEEATDYRNKTLKNPEVYAEKGYLVNPDEEDKLFRAKYLDFIDERESDEVQLFFTPWYTCNFDCLYCFQDEYGHTATDATPEVVEAFFNYIDTTFANRKKYITLFGGEPLLLAPAKRAIVEQLLSGAKHRQLDVAIVTNGYHLTDYIDLFKTARIREIQVTLDGPQAVHDTRRILKGGQGTFERIANGIDALLQHHIAVNLRMIVDKDNLPALPELANMAIQRGWTKSPLFKTALGRNYELHHCQTNNQRLYSRINLYKDLYHLVQQHPKILEFHKPAFSISKFIFENGELPNPLYDSCSGAKTEWAFDYSGHIYSCTATVGNKGDELGTFYPTVTHHHEKIEEWQERDVLTIDKCRSCAVQLACGGGCAAIARNRTGKLHETDCRPVEELLGLGIALYSSLEVSR